MFKLFRFLKPHILWFVLAPLAMALEVSMDIMQPALMSNIIDNGISQGNQSVIYQTGWRMMLYAVLGLIGGCSCTFFASKAAIGFATEIRLAIFKTVEKFSFAEIDKLNAGSLVTRIVNDVRVMQMFIMMMTRMLIRAPLMIIGSIIIILVTDPYISIPIILTTPILAAIVVSRIKIMRPKFDLMQSKLDSVNTIMQENLTGIRVVKSFNKEKDEINKFELANTALSDVGIETGKIMVTLGPIIGTVQQIALISIIFIAAHDANMKLLKIGEIVAIINYATNLMHSLVMVSFHLMHISRATTSSERINQILETKTSIQDGTVNTVPQIEKVVFDNISFAYPISSGLPVLSNINLVFKKGLHYGILGSTGSGKTSLINLLPRFYSPSSGNIFVNETNIEEFSFEALRMSLAIVMQDVKIFSGSIKDNIKWGNENASDEEVYEAARNAQAHEFISSLPNGYNTLIAQGGINLSGGQRQRIAIARALIRKPQILILDDSTSALDTITESAIISNLKSHYKDIMIISVAQRISSVKNADSIILLDNGIVCGTGTHEELKESNAIYKDILMSQSED